MSRTCPYCGHDLPDPGETPAHYLMCACGKVFTATIDPTGKWTWLPGVRPSPDLTPTQN